DKNILINNRIGKICDFGFIKIENDDNNSNFILFASDIYSLDIVFWKISSSIVLFKAFTLHKRIAIYIYKENREILVKDTKKWYLDLYTRYWNQEPEKRPNIKKVFEIINNNSV
ncbi:44216_t:CDS:2, partial [Gigaspora margarita]